MLTRKTLCRISRTFYVPVLLEYFDIHALAKDYNRLERM